MWSKQADTRNKNATSFKSKITNRKQKTSETRTSATQLSDSTAASPNSATPRDGKAGKKQKNRKNRKDCPQAKQVSSEPDLIDGLKKISTDDKTKTKATITVDEVTKSTNANVELSVETDGRLADVVLRNDGKPNGSVDLVDGGVDSYNLKRYSDSFVISADDSGSVRNNNCQPKLSRAVSGFIFTEPDTAEYNIKEGKVGRKTRRFSDLFHYGALKTCNSCDNLKISPKMIKNFEVDETGALDDDLRDVILRKVQQKPSTDTPKKAKGGKTNENGDSKNADVKNTKCKVETMPMTNTNNSYLKRVKSKIYKTKNDNNVGSSLPSMPDISETVKSKKTKNKKNAEIKSKVIGDGSEATPEVRKSIAHFDFRLIRQTSNLERIRPRTFGPKKSSSNTGITDIPDAATAASNLSAEKPVLAKSKSSSAINLNMLRTRRNKIMEQVKNRNCKVVQNEFDFIAFSNRINSSAPINRKCSTEDLNGVNGIADKTSKPDVREQQTQGKNKINVCRENSRNHKMVETILIVVYEQEYF